jgi:ribonuclease D
MDNTHTKNNESSILEASHLEHTRHIDQGAGGSKQMPFKILFPNPTTAKRLHRAQEETEIIPKAIGLDTF